MTEATVTRIIKEVGSNFYKSRDKRVFISRDRQRGNCWNSMVVAFELIKKNLYLDIYVQYSNSDCNTTVKFKDFFSRGSFTGSVVRGDYYGNDRHYYYTYSEQEKGRVLKSLLEEYVISKYQIDL